MATDEPIAIATLAFDDPRLVPLVKVLARLIETAGARGPAESDLNAALAREDDGLRCFERYQDVRTRKWALGKVFTNYWDSYRVIYCRWQDEDEAQLGVVPRGRGPHQIDVRRLLYGWLPDLERLWPNLFLPKPAPTAEPPADARPRQQQRAPRPGTARHWIDIVGPNETWRYLSGGELQRRAKKQAEQLNIKNEQAWEAGGKHGLKPLKIPCPDVRAFEVAKANRLKEEGGKPQ